MPEPFQIVDPIESFVEAREESVPGRTDTAKLGAQIKLNRALWWTGAAFFVISTLLLVNTINQRIGDDSDAAPSSRQAASDSQPPPTVTARAQSIHAIDPEAPAVQGDDNELQPSQEAATPYAVTSDRQTAAVETSASAQSMDKRPAIGRATGALPRGGLGNQPIKLPSAASIRSAPSASADIIGTVYAGAEVRIAARTSEWVQIVDPSSGRTGWIASNLFSQDDLLSTALNEPLAQGAEIPEENALPNEENALPGESEAEPAAKVKKRSAKRRHGRKRFVIRLDLGRLLRR